MDNRASSRYEGIQAKLEKRFAKGLTFRANYSFGKVIDVGGAGFSQQRPSGSERYQGGPGDQQPESHAHLHP